MGIKTYKPTSSGRRFQTALTYAELTTDKPHKALLAPKKKIDGRNNLGRITIWWRGSGNKRRFRIIDFKREKAGIKAKVLTVEYDPNRSAFISLVCYEDGEKRYILYPEGLKVGDKIMSGPDADILPGNALPLKNIPTGTIVHNVELRPGRGAQIVRAAGGSAQIMAKEGNYAHVKLPSGEIRLVNIGCYATVGQVGNVDNSNIKVGKAGRNRWIGRKSHVRGTAMNPVDHPHGGGEGKTKGGRHPVTPWGQPTKGYKTRKNKRTSAFIVKRRK